MAKKVLGIRELDLNSGVSAEEFEQFITQVLPQLPKGSGLKQYILKADRGDRNGKYLMVTEMDSVETRDRYWPNPDQPSEEGARLDTPAEVMEQFGRFVAPSSGMGFTDYAVIAANE